MVRIHTTAIGPGGENVDFLKVEEGPNGTTIGRIKLSQDGIKDFRSRFVTVGTSPIELLSGPTRLEDAVSLSIVNDSSALFYVRPGGAPDLVNGNYLIIFSGQVLTFSIDKDEPISIYGVMDEGSTTVRVIEVV